MWITASSGVRETTRVANWCCFTGSGEANSLAAWARSPDCAFSE